MNNHKQVQSRAHGNGKWASNVKHGFKASEQEIASVTEQVLESLGEGLADGMKSGRKTIRNAGHSAMELVRENPLPASLGAVAFGIYIGAKFFASKKA